MKYSLGDMKENRRPSDNVTGNGKQNRDSPLSLAPSAIPVSAFSPSLRARGGGVI